MHDDELQLALLGADRRGLVRAATRLLGPTDAEDAVQDAYVRTLEASALELNAAQAWLLTVVRRLAIDRLRRQQWLRQWLEAMGAADGPQVAPSAEADVALAQQVARALRRLAEQLSPQDGAALLLHLVFEAGHAEIARASGRSEAGSRQQLRRALWRLRQADGTRHADAAPDEEAACQLYLQSLQLRDPQRLWALLRQPTIEAAMTGPSVAAKVVAPTTACRLVQLGGQLGLALTLDGVSLCVLPLGVRPAQEPALL